MVLRLLLVSLAAMRPLFAQTAPPSEPLPTLDIAVAHVTTGGSWRSGSTRGHYRLIVYDGAWERLSSRLLIQWIEEDAAQHRLVVRDTRMVGVIAETWTLGAPQFTLTTRGVKATVAGTDPHNGHAATWMLTLGPPGQFSVSPIR